MSRARWFGLVSFALLLPGASLAQAQGQLSSQAQGRPLAEVEETDGRPHVTFVGFQPLQGGGGRIFVHLTGAPSSVQTSSKDKTATISLADVGIGAKNNKYPLDLQNFGLPVTRVQLEARGSSVDVVLTLRTEFPLHPRLQKRPDGAVVLELEVPAP